jgi:hypothetical protein
MWFSIFRRQISFFADDKLIHADNFLHLDTKNGCSEVLHEIDVEGVNSCSNFNWQRASIAVADIAQSLRCVWS